MTATFRTESNHFPFDPVRVVRAADAIIRRVATPSLAQLVLRLGLATPFLRSGILKWDGFLQLDPAAIYLFSDEFKLHLPGGPFAFPAPEIFAFLSGCAEVGLPVLLVLGLGTRFAAFGLLLMTIIIELTAPEAWPIHITWAAMEFGIMAGGAGRIALDHLIARQFPDRK